MMSPERIAELRTTANRTEYMSLPSVEIVWLLKRLEDVERLAMQRLGEIAELRTERMPPPVLSL